MSTKNTPKTATKKTSTKSATTTKKTSTKSAPSKKSKTSRKAKPAKASKKLNVDDLANMEHFEEMLNKIDSQLEELKRKKSELNSDKYKLINELNKLKKLEVMDKKDQ